ncbi:MAG: hypothetical protein ACOCUU_00430 [Nanoarchaeota archaeon]
MSQKIADMYMESLAREQASRTALSTAVATIEGATGGKYDLGAMTAEETARRVLVDRDSGLSPSERAEWGDRVRNAYKTQAYLSVDIK